MRIEVRNENSASRDVCFAYSLSKRVLKKKKKKQSEHISPPTDIPIKIEID
jgi:hypothetical protein